MGVTEYICRTCNQNLSENKDKLICSQCDRSWLIKEGIPIFSEKDLDYSREISLDKMKEVNDLSQKIGWEKAQAKVLEKKVQDIILRQGSADWRYLSGAASFERVLDVGCGFGTLSFSFAQSSKIVYALESAWERIKFVDIRRRQDNINNIRPICSDALTLPFCDNFFDIVVLNGVLEWVGHLDNTVSPSVAQKKVLKEIFRILKSKGVLYIGIKNKFALRNFLRKKIQYNPYLRTYQGYDSILDKTGFKSIEFYMPLPNYDNFRCLFPLNNLATIRYWMDNLIYPRIASDKLLVKAFFSLCRLVFRPALQYIVKLFALDYSIFAAKEKPKDILFKKLIISKHEGKRIRDISFFQCKGFRKNLFFAFLNSNSYPSYVCKITEEFIGKERLKNEAAILKKLASLSGEISQALPKVLYEEAVDNNFCVLVTAKRGSPLSNYLRKYRNNFGKLDDIFSNVRSWLTTMHKETSSIEGSQASEILMNIAKESIEFADKVMLLREKREYLLDFFNKEISQIKEFTFVLQHKDFTLENMNYEKSKASLAIFDWEYALRRGLPLIDLLNFFVNSTTCIKSYKHKEGLREILCLSRQSVPRVYRFSEEMFLDIFYKENKLSALIKSQLKAYQRDMNIDDKVLKLIFLLFILQHLSHSEVFLRIFFDRDDNILWKKV